MSDPLPPTAVVDVSPTVPGPWAGPTPSTGMVRPGSPWQPPTASRFPRPPRCRRTTSGPWASTAAPSTPPSTLDRRLVERGGHTGLRRLQLNRPPWDQWRSHRARVRGRRLRRCGPGPGLDPPDRPALSLRAVVSCYRRTADRLRERLPGGLGCVEGAAATLDELRQSVVGSQLREADAERCVRVGLPEPVADALGSQPSAVESAVGQCADELASSDSDPIASTTARNSVSPAARP